MKVEHVKKDKMKKQGYKLEIKILTEYSKYSCIIIQSNSLFLKCSIFIKERDKLIHIIHSYWFVLACYTTIEVVSLIWEDFVDLCALIYFSITLEEHGFQHFQTYYTFYILGLITIFFLKPLVGSKGTSLSC